MNKQCYLIRNKKGWSARNWVDLCALRSVMTAVAAAASVPCSFTWWKNIRWKERIRWRRDYLIRNRKGWSTMISRGITADKGTTITAVAAAASVPSSFTWWRNRRWIDTEERRKDQNILILEKWSLFPCFFQKGQVTCYSTWGESEDQSARKWNFCEALNNVSVAGK